MTNTQVWYTIGIVSSSPTHFQSERVGLLGSPISMIFLSVLVSKLVGQSVTQTWSASQTFLISQSVKPILSVKVKKSVKLIQLNFDILLWFVLVLSDIQSLTFWQGVRTLSYYEQNYVAMTKLDYNNIMSFDTENKFFNPIWVKIINPIYVWMVRPCPNNSKNILQSYT